MGMMIHIENESHTYQCSEISSQSSLSVTGQRKYLISKRTKYLLQNVFFQKQVCKLWKEVEPLKNFSHNHWTASQAFPDGWVIWKSLFCLKRHQFLLRIEVISCTNYKMCCSMCEGHFWEEIGSSAVFRPLDGWQTVFSKYRWKISPKIHSLYKYVGNLWKLP